MCDRRPNSAHFFALSCHSLFSHSTYLSLLSLYIKCHVALCVALCFHLPIAALYTQNQNLRHVSFPLFLFFPFWFCLCFCLLSSLCPYSRMWNDKQSSSLSAVHVCGIVAVFFLPLQCINPCGLDSFKFFLSLSLTHCLVFFHTSISQDRINRCFGWAVQKERNCEWPAAVNCCYRRQESVNDNSTCLWQRKSKRIFYDYNVSAPKWWAVGHASSFLGCFFFSAGCCSSPRVNSLYSAETSSWLASTNVKISVLSVYMSGLLCTPSSSRIIYVMLLRCSRSVVGFVVNFLLSLLFSSSATLLFT